MWRKGEVLAVSLMQFFHCNVSKFSFIPDDKYIDEDDDAELSSLCILIIPLFLPKNRLNLMFQLILGALSREPESLIN